MSRRNARKQPQPGQHPRSLAREGLDVAHELVAALLLQATADPLDALRRLSRDPRRAAVPLLAQLVAAPPKRLRQRAHLRAGLRRAPVELIADLRRSPLAQVRGLVLCNRCGLLHALRGVIDKPFLSCFRSRWHHSISFARFSWQRITPRAHICAEPIQTARAVLLRALQAVSAPDPGYVAVRSGSARNAVRWYLVEYSSRAAEAARSTP